MPNKFEEENAIHACKSILRFIQEYKGVDRLNPEIREAMLEDLCAKSLNIESILRAAFLTEGLFQCAPERIREIFDADKFNHESLSKLPSHTKMHVNIGIVTVIRPELKALLYALERDPNEKENISHGAFRYWIGRIQRPTGPSLSYVLTMVGESRNVPCVLAIHNLLVHYSVDLMVLVGIAGGPKDKVKCGDAIAIVRVFDYEHVRAELINGGTIEKSRPELYRLETSLRNDIEYYHGEGMNAAFLQSLQSMPKEWMPKGIFKESIIPNYHAASSAAGERLFADGSLNQMWKYDERIRAGDMEDSGFAQACEFYEMPWVIFRGISDFGDPHKNKEWHHVSALSASSAALGFLRFGYRLPSGEF